jgi:hypothetical protein
LNGPSAKQKEEERKEAVPEGILFYQLHIATATVEWASHTHAAIYCDHDNMVDFEAGPATATSVSADLMTISH